MIIDANVKAFVRLYGIDTAREEHQVWKLNSNNPSPFTKLFDEIEQIERVFGSGLSGFKKLGKCLRDFDGDWRGGRYYHYERNGCGYLVDYVNLYHAYKCVSFMYYDKKMVKGIHPDSLVYYFSSSFMRNTERYYDEGYGHPSLVEYKKETVEPTTPRKWDDDQKPTKKVSRCYRCGCTVPYGENDCGDHVSPLSRGCWQPTRY